MLDVDRHKFWKNPQRILKEMVNAEFEGKKLQTREVFEPFLGGGHDPRAPLNTISSGWKKTRTKVIVQLSFTNKNAVDLKEPLRVSYKPVYAIYKGNNPA